LNSPIAPPIAFLTALSIAAVVFSVAVFAAENGTGSQHHEWMRKFETPSGSLRGEGTAEIADEAIRTRSCSPRLQDYTSPTALAC
jgi:hypothetical protein